MKFAPLLVMTTLLGACTLFTPTIPVPKGVANITPQSGAWTVGVEDHPELSGTYQFSFITNMGPSTLKVVTPQGNTAQAPVNWSSGNVQIYITYKLSDGVTIVSDLMAIAIESATEMTGVYTYNDTGVASTIANIGSSTTTQTSEPTYSSIFKATYGAAASPTPGATTSATPSAGATSSAAPAPSSIRS